MAGQRLNVDGNGIGTGNGTRRQFRYVEYVYGIACGMQDQPFAQRMCEWRLLIQILVRTEYSTLRGTKDPPLCKLNR